MEDEKEIIKEYFDKGYVVILDMLSAHHDINMSLKAQLGE